MEGEVSEDRMLAETEIVNLTLGYFTLPAFPATSSKQKVPQITFREHHTCPAQLSL